MRLADKRQPFCRHYDTCLSLAAHNNVDLICAGCARYQHQDHNPTDFDVCGSFALVAAVFRQEYGDHTPQELVSLFSSA